MKKHYKPKTIEFPCGCWLYVVRLSEEIPEHDGYKEGFLAHDIRGFGLCDKHDVFTEYSEGELETWASDVVL